MLRRSVDKDDLLTRIRIREIALFGLIALTAVFTNLPAETVEEFGINPDYLVAALASAVVVGLFLYLRFFFFFSVVLLIVGANMPEQIAERLGISKIPLLLALAAMIGISLINYVVKLMPTGGVTLTNAGEWIKAGACAVGVGSNLVDAKALAANDFAQIAENARTVVASVKSARA